MRLISHFITAIFCAYGLAATIKPLKPSEDDFYKIPKNITDYEPGDLVKWRAAPQKIRSVVFPINVKHSWQYMVRSTNSQGEAVGIVGTVLEPYDADPTKMVVYHTMEDSASPNCAPSYSILYGASSATIALELEALVMDVLFTKGWYVILPDYEGPNAAFVAGRLAGMASLDSIRGVLKTGKDTGIDPDAQVALWGFSGGTLPTSWASVLQPTYAPELENNLVGAAFGGWVSNITRTIHYLEGGIFSGFLAAGILGLVTEYPDVQDEIWKLVDHSKASKLNETANQCLIQTLVSFPYTKFFSGKDPYFPSGFAMLDRPEIRAMLLDNTITANESIGLPQIPLFLYHGIPDEVIPFENAEEGFTRFCEWGVESFEFAASNTSGHIMEFIEGAGAAITWIEKRFEGKKPIKGCKKTERESNFLYPGADKLYYDIIRTDLEAGRFEPLGPALQGNATISRAETTFYNWAVKMLDKMGPIPVKRDVVLNADHLKEIFHPMR